jgi:hypothetical protein
VDQLFDLPSFLEESASLLLQEIALEHLRDPSDHGGHLDVGEYSWVTLCFLLGYVNKKTRVPGFTLQSGLLPGALRAPPAPRSSPETFSYEFP